MRLSELLLVLRDKNVLIVDESGAVISTSTIYKDVAYYLQHEAKEIISEDLAVIEITLFD